MSDVVILILFTYPGVFAEYIYHCLAKGKSFPDKVDEVFRVARDFFVSAFVTMIALWVFSIKVDMPYDLKMLMTELQAGSNLWIYCCISIVLSGLTGCAWYGLALIVFRYQNRHQFRDSATTTSINKLVWLDFRKEKEDKLKGRHVILAIHKDGKLVQAGFLDVLTYDPAEDPGIALYATELVSDEMCLPVQKWEHVDAAVSSYYDMSTGTMYSVYDGTRMYSYMESLVKDTE